MTSSTQVLLNEAVSLAHEFKTNEHNTVVLAAILGKKLIDIKTALPNGEFTKYLENNMPVKPGQCQKFMKLYRLKPELASKAYLKQVFTIDSEITLAKADDDIEEKVRTEAEEKSLNQIEILALIKRKEAEKRGESESTEDPAPTPTTSDLLKKVSKISEVLQKVINTEINPLDGSEPWSDFIYKMSDTVSSIDDAIFQYGMDLEKIADSVVPFTSPASLKMLPAPQVDSSNKSLNKEAA